MNESLSIHPRPIRRRLWKSGGLLAIFIAALFAGNFFLPPNRAVTPDMLGHDFLPFYAAGVMARHGNFRDLYNLTAIKTLESSIGHSAGWSNGFGPFWNPPFTAWLFAPFTFLPFSKALLLWEALSALALVASILLMSRWIPDGGDWRNWGLIALLIAVSNPFIAVVTHAQNSCLTLLLMTITITLWRARCAFAAGLVCGLLFYKPQHAPVLALALIFTLGWRSAAGLFVTGLSLLLATEWTMPGTIADYAHKLPAIALTMQELSPYAWDRHVTLKAFWRLLFQGTQAGPTQWPAAIFWWTSETLVAILLIRQLLCSRRDPEQRDRAITLTIVAGPLLALFCFDYDLLILAAPAVLCAGEMMRRGTNRRLMTAWIALFLALHVNMHVARPTDFILATPALIAMMICTLSAPRKRQTTTQSFAPDPRALAA